jgi:hypothetical protein
MLPGDEQLFFDYVLKDGDVKAILEHLTEPRIEIIPSQNLVQKGSINLPDFLIWNTNNPLPFEQIKIAHLQKYDEDIMDYVPTGQVSYYVDKDVTPVIEYTPSRIRPDGEISQGRIWAQMYYVEGNEWVYKGDAFNKYYEKIARWIRKNFSRIENADGYFGPEAFKLHKDGNLLINYYGCFIVQSAA